MRAGDSYEELRDLPNLRTTVLGRPLLITETTESTNDDAKLLANENLLGHGAVLLARTQSGGKGRLGRQWASPRGGVFMSVILQPEVPPERVPGLSLAVGYSVACALRDGFDLDAKIKWPNDVLVGGRKLCGILCEMKAEEGHINYVIAGIGVNANLRAESFPGEVRDRATSMAIELGHGVNQDLVVSSILNHFEPIYEEFALRGLKALAKRITDIAAYLGERVIIQNRVAHQTLEAVTKRPEVRDHQATGESGITGWMTSGASLPVPFDEGIFAGIDEAGRLLLDNGGIIRAFDVGDLSLRSV